MMGFGAGETVFHLPFLGQVKDADGHRKDTWGAPAPVPDTGVDVPGVTEPRDGLAVVSEIDLVLFAPPGFTCGQRDRFEVRGKTYEVEGVTEPITNFFTGTAFRTEVKLRRFNG